MGPLPMMQLVGHRSHGATTTPPPHHHMGIPHYIDLFKIVHVDPLPPIYINVYFSSPYICREVDVWPSS